MPAAELREAIDHGDVPRARELLRSEPALATALIAAPDIEPTSPLTYVGMVRFYGYADHERTGELAEVLMQAGADKDDETKNGSPLICAASHGDVAVVLALLDAGADVELIDADAPSDTALRVAAAYGFPEIVDELIAAGAKVSSVIEAAGAGNLTGWSIAELSDLNGPTRARQPSTSGSRSSTNSSPPGHRSTPRWMASPPSTGPANKADRGLSSTSLTAVLHGRTDNRALTRDKTVGPDRMSTSGAKPG